MATDIEKTNLESLGIDHKNVQVFDFRPFQILSRIKNIDSANSILSSIIECLKKDKRQKIILGSFWADEVEFLINPPADFFDRFQLVLVPHKLDIDNIEACKSVLTEIFSKEVLVHSKSRTVGNITILDYKGILCELYQFFDYSYVAGGFRSSVHSLLEPFLSNSKVLCGPSISKSTEYDMILNIDKRKISIIEQSSFYDELSKDRVDYEKVDHFKSSVATDHIKYINWVLN
jgi:3-deoxy-D-manno-octulosonic-acid transferase